MKKLLLLCALLIFACSSDEGNDDYDNNSNQTFLERYDGVVWENPFFISNPQNEEDLYSSQYLTLNNSNEFLTYYRPNLSMINENVCFGLIEGLNSNGATYNITINNYNALQFTSDLAEENSFAIVDVSVLNNTIYLDISYSNSTNTYQEFANRTTLSNPCD